MLCYTENSCSLTAMLSKKQKFRLGRPVDRSVGRPITKDRQADGQIDRQVQGSFLSGRGIEGSDEQLQERLVRSLDAEARESHNSLAIFCS